MRISIFGRLLLASACVMTTVAARGQQTQSLKPAIDVAVLYHPLLANQVGRGDFWMQGGSVQLHAQLWRGLGVVADVSGVHQSSMNGLGVGLDLVTVTFGPRYSWTTPWTTPRIPHLSRIPRLHSAVFGELLVGEANGLNSVFPNSRGASDSASSLALSLGGGVNVPLPHHLTVRAFEADWLRTQLPNATSSAQNNLRLGTGLAYRF
jgi:hypothetical protein